MRLRLFLPVAVFTAAWLGIRLLLVMLFLGVAIEAGKVAGFLEEARRGSPGAVPA